MGEVTPEVRATIADMTETMYDEVGIGLAAPQVGIALRLIVVADEEGRGVQALLNPAIVDRGGEATGEEGCLSIPGVFAPGHARGVGEDRGAGRRTASRWPSAPPGCARGSCSTRSTTSTASSSSTASTR